MPSSQVPSGGCQIASENAVAIKPPPPPSKLPPPPPPPPKNIRPQASSPPPPPPPPPPPRNSSQIGANTNHTCPNVNLPDVLLHNNGNSINSAGCIGRCARVHQYSEMNSGLHQPIPNQRGFTRHGECGARSSITSHNSSVSHHYHGAGAHHVPNPISTNAQSGTVHCNHQPGIGCSWSANQQHSHVNPASLSDNGSCVMYHGQAENCCFHHPSAANNKCQAQGVNLGVRTTSGFDPTPTNSTICRSTLFSNEIDHHLSDTCTAAHSQANTQNTVSSALPHFYHHHHHSHHHEQVHSSNQANQMDLPQAPNEGHRCVSSSQSGFNGMPHGFQSTEPMLAARQCAHIHKHNGCNHQPTDCPDHSVPPSTMQQQQVSTAHHVHRGPCTNPFDETLHHDCNTSSAVIPNSNMSNSDNCPHRHHHHHHSDQCPLVQVRCQEASNNGGALPSLTTAHVHNLSNSSTTTHTSNVAVKGQLQYHNHNHRPILSRGTRSSSSQQYEQYGLSSAASTSSATASLSSYHTPTFDLDGSHHQYLSSKIHQPLPPAPPPLLSNHNTTSASKSHPASLSQQVSMKSNNGPMFALAPSNTNHMPNGGQFNHQQPFMQTQQLPQPPPPLPPLPSQLHISQQPLPPLPPKPVSPNASSCSTQITTVRTSPSLQSQPITRITSHAGLQSPLPDSDVPPPLPPLKHGSRAQPLIDALMSKMTITNEQGVNRDSNQLDPTLNYSRGGIITDAERKTEAIARQVELDIDQRRRSGQPLGTCGICKSNIMPSQDACEAENQIFHTNCFVCCECGRTLQGKKYYPVGDQAYCEEDYQYSGHLKSLEKCFACGQPIFNMILPALGKFYHPKCFKCCVCNQCLDGVPFTIDRKNNIYCIKDYHNIYSPKCAACGKPISPIDGTSETVRVVSMDKDYHVDCYCCEDCGLQLTDEEPSRCFPLDSHLLCQKCHIGRLTAMKAALSMN